MRFAIAACLIFGFSFAAVADSLTPATPAPAPATAAAPAAPAAPAVELTAQDMGVLKAFVGQSKLHETLEDGSTAPLVNGVAILNFLATKTAHPGPPLPTAHAGPAK